MQRLAGPQDKALASAFLLFCIAVIGSGAGPYVVGWISDMHVQQGSEAALLDGLRASLLAYVVATLFFLLAGRLDRQPARCSAGVP